MQFALLDGNEPGVLIQKIFENCEKFCLSKSCLKIWFANQLIDLKDAPLYVIFKKNKGK